MIPLSNRLRRIAPAGALFLGAALALAVPAQAQTLGDAMRQGAGRQAASRDTVTNRAPAPSWTVVVGQVVAGTALAAAASYGVGLVASVFCDQCDAGEPGGDTPGLLLGVPAGAFAGVWLVGRQAPPPGKTEDTLLGAMAGTAVFAAYARILEEQSDLVRWGGIVLPAALAAMGWSRSRFLPEPEVTFRRGKTTGWGRGQGTTEVTLLRVSF